MVRSKVLLCAFTDAKEVLYFSKLKGDWWNRQGPLFSLHTLNPIRVAYLRSWCEIRGEKILDVGCGAGILSYSLARIGAKVTGIDVTPALIEAANACQTRQLMKQPPEFFVHSLEKHEGKYDVVILSEVLEHVLEPSNFLRHGIQLLRAGGTIMVSTINKTFLSYIFVKQLAERTGIIPQGTHDHDKFIPATWLQQELQNSGVHVLDVKGMVVVPHFLPTPRLDFQLSNDFTLMNYFMVGRKT